MGRSFGNDATNNFYTQYQKIIIENNDSADNYWLLKETLECNEIVINDGGRFYGPSTGTKAGSIRSVKRPTVRGDWNFRQVTDGIYESIGDSSNVSVYHGGTGRQTLTKNALLYGDGMNDVAQLSLGSAGNVLAVNSGGTGIEWSSTAALHPCFFERSSINTTAVDFRSPTVQSSTANPNAFPMPFGGRVAAATFLFAGGSITGTATNTIRIRKNGGATTQDFTFTPSDLVNTNGTNYTLTKTGSDVDFDFNAGDILQVRRESGTTNLYNGQAVLWVKFNNG